jgi:hypothetical protein
LATFRNFLARRLPGRSEALPVFSLAVFYIYSWTIFRMFYELPSWLYYLDLAKILVLVAYAMMFALVESVLLLVFTCLVCMLLPARIFRRRFVPQGSLLVSLVCFAAVTAQRRLGWILQMQSWQIIVVPLAFILLSIAVLFLAAWIFDRYARIPGFLQGFAERVSVFAYLYLPVGLLSLLVVIFRNLVGSKSG